jgi:hypothetical protein
MHDYSCFKRGVVNTQEGVKTMNLLRKFSIGYCCRQVMLYLVVCCLLVVCYMVFSISPSATEAGPKGKALGHGKPHGNPHGQRPGQREKRSVTESLTVIRMEVVLLFALMVGLTRWG